MGVARVAGAGADDDAAAGAEGDREDDLGDDEDETGGPAPAPHMPVRMPTGARLRTPDPRDEFWDAKVVKVMQRCPLT